MTWSCGSAECSSTRISYLTVRYGESGTCLSWIRNEETIIFYMQLTKSLKTAFNMFLWPNCLQSFKDLQRPVQIFCTRILFTQIKVCTTRQLQKNPSNSNQGWYLYWGNHLSRIWNYLKKFPVI